jgi:hypothetical protein
MLVSVYFLVCNVLRDLSKWNGIICLARSRRKPSSIGCYSLELKDSNATHLQLISLFGVCGAKQYGLVYSSIQLKGSAIVSASL